MKKLLFVLSLIFVVHYTYAQRKCNLQCTQYIPGPGWELQNGRPFDITAKVKNLGPDEVRVADSIAYYLMIDGSYIMSGGVPLGKGKYGYTIAVGEEITVPLYAGLSMTINNNGNHDFCTQAILLNRSKTDSAGDPVTANNIGCSSVKMNPNAVGIFDDNLIYSGPNELQLSPNPSNGITSLAYTLGEKSDVKILVRDIQGREVMMVLNESQELGEHKMQIDISGLKAGIYIVEYYYKDKVVKSKLVKQ